MLHRHSGKDKSVSGFAHAMSRVLDCEEVVITEIAASDDVLFWQTLEYVRFLVL